MSSDESDLFRAYDRALALVANSAFEDLPEAVWVLVAIWQLEADVNNGGFDQYFFNSAGDLAWFVPSALEAVGARHTATLVRAANELFGPKGPSRDRYERQKELERIRPVADGRLEELDQAFYEYRDDLSTLVTQFLKQRAPTLLEP